MQLNSENFTNFIDRLRFHNRGKGVDDHCTADPIFIVQSLERIHGIDLDYDPKYYWTDNDGESMWSDDDLLVELAEYVSEGGTHEDFDIESDCGVDRRIENNDGTYRRTETVFRKIGYCESWQYVNAHFTKESAKAFIKRKSHDYGKLRIFVDSQYWCKEFNAIIEGLLDGRIILSNSNHEEHW